MILEIDARAIYKIANVVKAVNPVVSIEYTEDNSVVITSAEDDFASVRVEIQRGWSSENRITGGGIQKFAMDFSNIARMLEKIKIRRVSAVKIDASEAGAVRVTMPGIDRKLETLDIGEIREIPEPENPLFFTINGSNFRRIMAIAQKINTEEMEVSYEKGDLREDNEMVGEGIYFRSSEFGENYVSKVKFHSEELVRSYQFVVEILDQISAEMRIEDIEVRFGIAMIEVKFRLTDSVLVTYRQRAN